jgi:hypothetical protein
MRDVYEVLREKEDAAERVRREINALSSAAPLLVEGTDIEPTMLPQWAHDGRDRTCEPNLQEENPATGSLRVPRRVSRGKTRSAADIAAGPGKRISRQLKRLASPLLDPGSLAG